MLSIAVGALMTIPISGFAGDAILKYLAKKKNGHLVSSLFSSTHININIIGHKADMDVSPTTKPEHQLLNLILPVVIGFIGTLCYGVAAANPDRYHWIFLLAMMSCQFFASTAINIISTTYTIECYPDLAGVMVIVCGAYRNIIGFGLTYGAQPFMEAVGALRCFGTYAGILGGLGLVGIFFYFMGLAVRRNVNSWKIRRSAFADMDQGHGDEFGGFVRRGSNASGN
jgi:hypothetical protein